MRAVDDARSRWEGASACRFSTLPASFWAKMCADVAGPRRNSGSLRKWLAVALNGDLPNSSQSSPRGTLGATDAGAQYRLLAKARHMCRIGNSSASRCSPALRPASISWAMTEQRLHRMVLRRKAGDVRARTGCRRYTMHRPRLETRVAVKVACIWQSAGPVPVI